VSSHYRD
jgi:starvation-inducible DNA-binding protein